MQLQTMAEDPQVRAARHRRALLPLQLWQNLAESAEAPEEAVSEKALGEDRPGRAARRWGRAEVAAARRARRSKACSTAKLASLDRLEGQRVGP